MLSYTSQESFITPDRKDVLSFLIPYDMASVMYDFTLTVTQHDLENFDHNPVLYIATETNGNYDDKYTVKYWPNALPKRVDNQLIYRLDFWYNSPDTPFHSASTSPAHRLIRVKTNNRCSAKLTNTNLTYVGDEYKNYHHKLCGAIGYSAFTHSELIVPADYHSVLLRYVLGGFCIYCESTIAVIESISVFSLKTSTHSIYQLEDIEDQTQLSITLSIEQLTNSLVLKQTTNESRYASSQYADYNIVVNFRRNRESFVISHYQYNYFTHANGWQMQKFQTQPSRLF